MVSAPLRAAPPKPRGGQWRWRGQRSEPVWEGSASVSTIHAPFPTEVEYKMHGHSPENFESHDPPDPTRCRPGCCPPFALKDRLPRPWPEPQMRIIQLAREGSPPPALRRPQAKLPRKSNQLARA